MNIYQLKNKLGQEVVDYNQLKDVLKDYSQPRKICRWPQTHASRKSI
jgi:hypothetical protein